ncbi:MAG: TIGR00266 family protein [Bacteroidales bacterium]|nr:TIGR00266 family protein [Bacteroidales bacterium]
MQSHEVDYKIIGHDIQLVEIELDPQETVIAEAGAMLYMREGIEFETKMGDGSNPDQGFMGKLISMGSRALTGESLFMTHFTNRGFGKSTVAFAAPYPGTIVPIDLNIFGGQLIVQKAGFLCAALGTKISVHFNKKIGSGLFGGEGFILQKLQGDGLAFIHAGGTLIEHELKNETIRVDTGCVVAFDPNIDFSIETAGGLKSMLFGGEGIFLTTLRGTGKVWLQSMPFSKLVQAIMPGSPESKRGKGSILGNFID